MIAVIYLIERLALGLYVIIGVIAVMMWVNWSRARWAYRATQFELERDIARYHSANAFTGLVLLIEVGLIIAGIQNVVAPTLRASDTGVEIIEQVITDIEFNTPTPGPQATVLFNPDEIVFQNINPADRIFVTATPQPTPVGTIVPNAPALTGCDTPNAYLRIPGNGMRIFQITEVVGTAYMDDFAEYKLEIRGANAFGGGWASLEGSSSPVTQLGSLGQFNPAAYEPGLYQFRLVVFDVTSTMRHSCTINIYIEEPQPTRTPLAP